MLEKSATNPSHDLCLVGNIQRLIDAIEAGYQPKLQYRQPGREFCNKKDRFLDQNGHTDESDEEVTKSAPSMHRRIKQPPKVGHP